MLSKTRSDTDDDEPGGLDPPAPDGDEPLVRALAPIVAKLGTERERPEVVQAFAWAVLRRTPPTQLEQADPAATAASLADSFEFVDRRPSGEIRVRLTEPAVTLDGLRPSGTVMEVSCEDRQFIVTTVTEELHRLGQKVARILHPVYGSERAADGRLAAILPARTAPHRESFLQVELGGRVPARSRPALVEAVRGVLGDVFAATEDYPAMREQVAALAERTRQHASLRYPLDEVTEAAELLDWLLDGNFVLTGTCHVRRAAPGVDDVTDALGILSRLSPSLPRDGLDGTGPDRLLHIARTRQVSTVHRQVPMHRIDVVEVSPSGDAGGVFRLVGVFSHKADAEPVAVTPVLRFKLRRILQLEDVVEGSHDESALVSLFQALPKEELFESDVDSLRQTLRRLLAAEDQHEVRALLRVDPSGSSVSALLSVPHELYSPTLRRRLERFLLIQLDGSRTDVHVSLGDRPDAIIRVVVHIDGPLPAEPLASLERELRLLCRTWEEELAAALAARVGARGELLVRTWASWFPASYRDAVRADQAVEDVLQLEQLLTSASPDGGVRIVMVPDSTGRAQARLKVFTAGITMELSRFLPILESLGLWAVEDLSYVLGPAAQRVYLHDFGIRDPSGGSLEPERDGAGLSEAAVALWRGRAEVDSLNRLVMRAGMAWPEVAVLRAYRRYRSQVGTTFTTGYVDDVLVENASIARGLVELFAARFDAAAAAGADEVDKARRRVVEGCDAVARLDHDRILRGFLALIDATVRTNRYLGTGAPLALKFDSRAVPDMPRPVPFREIFVHGPSVEGVHLRWGPVARGGIRWSERPDDYRTEVLGLMRAQVLKNALIVPTGAKGGFVVKRGRYEADGPIDVRRAYEEFVTSLLDVTDNVVSDRVVPVPRRGDGDDPYLVVAADRGTAGFSDLANCISEEHHFWLGDAFASGGSRGYDHKRLGITARGAWVAVRHHFAELDVDLDAEPITVVGIGDMSGDVFGNAMLRSDRIRLVAAFDHRDVFLDPDPDPQASYQERGRLFALPNSSWQDYDRSLLSPGGGVWSRLDKRIELSPEAQAALGIDAEALAPPELIRAILEAPVALLFAGGIGTFVRASSEADADIDDRTNTEVRVLGSSIRARVVGEGANLAFTQRGRIQYARRGGRINTDAIDNSGGVDLSDREVNVKILLRAAVTAGELTMPQRDQLLEDVCDDVVAAVLHDSALQSTALSREQAASPARMEALEALMADLEAAAVVDRSVEALPAAEEMRTRGQVGLTRPELAVLLAGAKRGLASQLLASPVPDQPALGPVLAAYFPPALTTRFNHLLDSHRLRRELIASAMANDIVNRMGSTFVTSLAAETGAGAPAVAAAYWIAREVMDAPAYWRGLDTERSAHGTALVEVSAVLSGLLEALARDYLRKDEADDIAGTVARDRPPLAELEAAMPDLGTAHRRRQRMLRAEALVDRGLEPAAAVRWASLVELEIGPYVAELSRLTRRPVAAVAEAFMATGELLGIDKLLDRLRQLTLDDRWGRAARQGLVDDLDGLRRLGARRALADGPADEREAVRRFLAARAPQVAEVGRLLREVEGEAQPPLDALAVVTRAVRQAIG